MEKQDQFISKLHSIFGDNSADVVSRVSQPKKYFSFRTIKHGIQKTLGIEIFDGPFEDSFYANIADKNVVSALDRGIYIQSFSSMLAVKNLDIKSGDGLLDMCAAPGGKSAYAATLGNNEITIFALDNNIARLNAMKDNFNNLGVKNFEVRKMDASRAQSDLTMISRFNKIICDVPCSNEGLIRLGDSAFDFWNPKHSKHLPMLQKRILASAINCLKPGGTLVYSTCTFSPEENEEVVDWALQKFDDISLVEAVTENVPTIDGFTSWKKKTYSPTLSKAKRVLPDEKFDGFFIAKLLRR
jgi:16S rRNA C967 or C1407 C5-methylase (RsmB/RsmF family)